MNGCFLGAAGVGRRTLKRRLIDNYPDRYTTILPGKVRRQGKDYWCIRSIYK